MRNLFLGMAIAMLAMPVAANADQRNFKLTNGTGRVISEVYLSPVKADDWEEDVLADDVLPDGGSTVIRFVDEGDTCQYDVKVVHDNGDNAVWNGINVCEANEIVIQYEDDGTPIAVSK